jgi:alpha-tubulin suppressor-like RCC1 family protein
MSARRAAWLVAFVVLGCSSPTQLVVVVDSDLAVPSEIDRVIVRVNHSEGSRDAAVGLSSQSDLPQTIGISSSGKTSEVSLVAIGERDGEEVVVQEVRTGFSSGKSLVVRLSLSASCVGVDCPSERTCDAGHCVEVDRPPDTLPRWEGEEPGRYLVDAGSSTNDAGTASDASSPATRIRELALGRAHSCALTTGGSVWCWGANERGQLGDGTTGARSSPVRVDLPGPASAVAAGRNHGCAVVERAVFCWGANSRGQLGDGTTIANRPTPVMALDVSTANDVAAGGSHSCASLEDGTVRCWGANDEGQLGDRSSTDRPRPVPVDGLDQVQELELGDGFSCALRTRAVWCWGSNADGQLGVADPAFRPAALAVSGVEDVRSLAVGAAHVCAATGEAVVCWGANASGQLGDGSSSGRWTPQPANIGRVDGVSAGSAHTCVQVAGRAQCWGAGARGQLGDGTEMDRVEPVPVRDVDGVLHVAAGGEHSCAAERERVFCWGNNASGQLGDGTTTSRATPAEVEIP